MEINKIIFLDIDGVLNSRTFYTLRRSLPPVEYTDDRIEKWMYKEIDINALALLHQLVIRTKAKIVISSTWRINQDPLWFRLLFYRKGIEFPKDVFIGKTPILDGKLRGNEIKAWIDENNFTGKYVILDDDSDMLSEQKPFFVQTTHKLGFTWDEFHAALNILDETPQYYTDYPFECLGDKDGQPAQIRSCDLLSYDGNKYCMVQIGEYELEIKSGYIYTDFGRYGEVSCVSKDILNSLPKTVE